MTDSTTMERPARTTGPASMEEHLRWPDMTDEELKASIRRDPVTGEIDWTQFVLPDLTPEERDAIQKDREEYWKNAKHLLVDEVPLDEEELAMMDIDTRYTVMALQAKCECRFADHWEYSRKSRLDAETTDVAKRVEGMKQLLKCRNVEFAVREYGIHWLNH